MTRSAPAARLERVQQIQSRVAAAVGVRNGAVLAAVAEPADDGQTTAELWLYGIVGGYWWGFNDKAVADQLRGLNVDHITVRLNSPGGDAIQGIAIGNLLRNHKASVTVVVDGLAASAASIIAIAGDEVVMSPGSQMMLHDPWLFTIGNAKELRQEADFLDKQGANMAGVYALETGSTPEAMRAAMTAEPDGTWYTADEAVEAKLATHVGTVVAVSAAPEPPPLDLDTEDDMAARAAWDLEVLITPAARAAWSAHTPRFPAASAGGSTPPHEGSLAVAFSDEQLTTMRQELGLPENADEATIVAALSEALEERAEPTPTTSQAQVPDGMSLVDNAVLEELRATAEQGRAAREQQLQERREALVSAAVSDGRIPPARRDAWVAQLAADPGAEATLASLAPGLVPVEALGHSGDASTDHTDVLASVSDDSLDAYAASLGITKEALRG